jgi:hypothetical protein
MQLIEARRFVLDCQLIRGYVEGGDRGVVQKSRDLTQTINMLPVHSYRSLGNELRRSLFRKARIKVHAKLLQGG